YPVRSLFFVESTSVANPVFYFIPFVFASRYTENLVYSVPNLRFSATSRTISVCIYRFQEPNTVFESESFIGQSTHRTNINHVSDEFIVQRFSQISRNFSVITTEHHTVLTTTGNLVSCFHATVTQNTTVHMQLDFVSDVLRLKCSSFEFVSCFFFSVFVAQILQLTFSGLVTNRTIQRVVDQ